MSDGWLCRTRCAGRHGSRLFSPRCLVVMLMVSAGCTGLSHPLKQHGDIHRVFGVATAASAAYEQHDWQRAQREYSTLTTLAPEDANAWFRLGNASVLLDDLTSAAAAYRRAAELSTESMKPWYNLATVHLMRARLALLQARQRMPPAHSADAQVRKQLKWLDQMLKPASISGGDESRE